MGCERVLDPSIAELLAGKHHGVMARWGNIVAGRVWFKSEDRLKKNG